MSGSAVILNTYFISKLLSALHSVNLFVQVVTEVCRCGTKFAYFYSMKRRTKLLKTFRNNYYKCITPKLLISFQKINIFAWKTFAITFTLYKTFHFRTGLICHLQTFAVHNKLTQKMFKLCVGTTQQCN